MVNIYQLFLMSSLLFIYVVANLQKKLKTIAAIALMVVKANIFA